MEKPFRTTAWAWHESRKPFIAAKTFHNYDLNIKTLCKFFGDKDLTEITPQLVRDYQVDRLKQCAAAGVQGHHTINHETGVLQQILRRHKLWANFEDDYDKLPISKEVRGRILTPEEYDRLAGLKVENTRLEAAWTVAIISLNTTAGPKEILTLRLKDVDIQNGIFFVQPGGAKNSYRIRTIPLNESALAAMKRALTWASECGSTKPDHYVFPFRVDKTKQYDPTRHATDTKFAWKTIKALANIENFRRYDCRHHAITELLTDPLVSDETAEQIAGHISKEMKKRYSHIQVHTKRKALDRVNRSNVISGNGGTSGSGETPLTNSDIVALCRELPAEVVKAKIALSMTSCAFDVSIEAIKELTLAGVPKEVLVTMMLVPAQNVSASPLEAMQWTRLTPSTRKNRAVVAVPSNSIVSAAPSESGAPRLYLRDAAYDREKLSKEVWERPLIQVAPQYGLSDVALGKLCKRLNIPLPGRGYWEKKRTEAAH
jgi:integrase